MIATVGELLDEAEAAIRRSRAVSLWRPSDARVNAEQLLGAVLGKEITSDCLDEAVPAGKRHRFDYLRRRVAGGRGEVPTSPARWAASCGAFAFETWQAGVTPSEQPGWWRDA